MSASCQVLNLNIHDLLLSSFWSAFRSSPYISVYGCLKIHGFDNKTERAEKNSSTYSISASSSCRQWHRDQINSAGNLTSNRSINGIDSVPVHSSLPTFTQRVLPLAITLRVVSWFSVARLSLRPPARPPSPWSSSSRQNRHLDRSVRMRKVNLMCNS